MGGTYWYYWRPFERDIRKTLAALKHDVFAAGDYKYKRTAADIVEGFRLYREQVLASFTDERLAAAGFGEREQFETMLGIQEQQAIKANEKKKLPRTVEELLELAGEEGTHSVLDIIGISDSPMLGYISPLPAVMYRELFDDEKPTEEAIMEKLYDSYLIEQPRWQGLYIFAFENGRETKTLFVGSSGD